MNEAMLSGESTPLLKESVELREGSDKLDMSGSDRNSVLFSGTKALQVEAATGDITRKLSRGSAPDKLTGIQHLMEDAWLLCCEPALAPRKAHWSEP